MVFSQYQLIVTFPKVERNSIEKQFYNIIFIFIFNYFECLSKAILTDTSKVLRDMLFKRKHVVINNLYYMLQKVLCYFVFTTVVHYTKQCLWSLLLNILLLFHERCCFETIYKQGQRCSFIKINETQYLITINLL